MIIAAWKEAGWGEPELKNKIEVDEVELVLPVPATANVTKDVTKDVIKDSQKSSQKSSQKILELIQENPNVTTSEILSLPMLIRVSLEAEFKVNLR